MEFLLICGSNHYLFHSLRRLCKESGLDFDKIKAGKLPMHTPVGTIIAIIPDTRI